MRFVRTISAPASAERVFQYLSDFTTTTEWEPATVSTERVSGTGDVGTRYRNISRFMGRESTLEYVVTAYEPNRRFALRGENSSLVARDEMTLRDGGPATTLTYSATFTLKGWRKIATPLLAPAFKRLIDSGADGLRDALGRL